MWDGGIDMFYRPTEDQIETASKLREILGRELKSSEIERVLGISRQYVQRLLREGHIQPAERRSRNLVFIRFEDVLESQPPDKRFALDAGQRAALRAMRAQGVTLDELAKAFGVSVFTVQRVIKGK